MQKKKKKSLFQIAPIDTGVLLSSKSYNIALSLFVLYGFVVNLLEYVFFKDFFLSINPILFIVTYLILVIGGCVVSNASKTALGAFIGYNMLILPLGGLLSNTLTYWIDVNPDIILYAFIGTAAVTAIMVVFSLINPNLFLKLGSLVFVMLLATVVAEFLLWIIIGNIPVIFSYLIIVIMSFFIAYDFIMANKAPHTLRNAIVFATNLWLDILNIFIHLIDIFGDD